MYGIVYILPVQLYTKQAVYRPKTLNDLWPIALTSLVTKTLEIVFKSEIVNVSGSVTSV